MPQTAIEYARGTRVKFVSHEEPPHRHDYKKGTITWLGWYNYYGELGHGVAFDDGSAMWAYPSQLTLLNA